MADNAPDLGRLSEDELRFFSRAVHAAADDAPVNYRHPVSWRKKQAKPANDNLGELESPPLVVEKPEVETRTIQLFIKRAVDIIGAAVSLIVLLPALLLIAALIRIESRGSPLFRQRRTGRNGVLFDILKFRSMYAEAGRPDGTVQSADDGSRITRVGRFLRKTNLDELPQLWNVLIGDMSLVGPRPHVPGMLAAGKPYDALVVGYDHRHLMRPGLTGLAQARGLRGPTVDRWRAARRILCDVEYIRSFSIALDARIIMRTIANEFKGGTGS